MKFGLILTLTMLFSQSSWALEAYCDQFYRIQRDPTGKSFVMLRGGGGQYASWEWAALTEGSDGRLTYSKDAKIEWVSRNKLRLTVPSAVWSDERDVKCDVYTAVAGDELENLNGCGDAQGGAYGPGLGDC